MIDTDTSVTTPATTTPNTTRPDTGLDLRHLLSLSDDVGLFEHASGSIPRREHGYCVDDVARAVVVLCREPEPSGEVVRMADRYVTFLVEAQGPDGRFHNRLGYDGRWEDQPSTGDWWGRALWGLGTAAARGPEPWIRDAALASFERGCRPPSVHLRAMAFAALGAAEVLNVDPGHGAARDLLAAAAAAIGVDGSSHMNSASSMDGAIEGGAAGIGAESGGADTESWPWPQERLHYANAVLPEVLLHAGRHLGDRAAAARGLDLLGWLLETESASGHLSTAPAGGRSAGDPRPGFDQQPIEVAALADACATAFAVTADPRWARGVRLAAAWFDGDNDAHTVMRDPATGGGHDGLTPTGRNENQGAESTLALLSTLQHDRHLRTEAP